MPVTIVRGRELSRNVMARAAVHAGELYRELGRLAKLVIVAGSDASSQRLSSSKKGPWRPCRSRSR